MALLLLVACSGKGTGPTPDAGPTDAGPADAGTGDAGTPNDAGVPDAGPVPDGGTTDTLESNRNRLLQTYLAFLQSQPTVTQSNGLQGGALTSVCELWSKLDTSSQTVFLTLTDRMQGGTLSADGSSMLSHVIKAYRVVGGQGAQTALPGSCGGGEYNRMIMSMDATLQATLVAANTHKGAGPDLHDLPTHADAFWRDSHDLGGPHKPFDLSDETDPGAPRGQVQFFSNPASTAAGAPLGRMDLTTLVDAYALEMDQDYDCVHYSNPLCSFIDYTSTCLPQPAKLGTELYTANYEDFGPGWRPQGCP